MILGEMIALKWFASINIAAMWAAINLITLLQVDLGAFDSIGLNRRYCRTRLGIAWRKLTAKVRVCNYERIIAQFGRSWDSFFQADPSR